jgi:uncharacterized protein YcbK (DUF882 family)
MRLVPLLAQDPPVRPRGGRMLDLTLTRRWFLRASLLAGPALLALLDGAELMAGELPPGELSLYNTHTDERLEVCYRNPAGRYDGQALAALNRALRCHYTGDAIPMDLEAIEFLNLVDKALGRGHEIHIISGFRSPVYNRKLLRQGRGVVPHSLHLVGKAIDFRIPGVNLGTVRQTAVDLQLGGVGYYPTAAFVHIDSGRFRTW